jgi:leucyl aminopeptidase
MTIATTLPLDVQFAPLTEPLGAVSAILVGPDGTLGAAAAALDKRASGGVARAVAAAQFTGKSKSTIEILGAASISVSRLVLIGTGKNLTELDRVNLGGVAFAALSARKGTAASLVVDDAELGITAAIAAADLALGAVLRAYTFKKYQTRKSDDDNKDSALTNGDGGLETLTILTAKPDAARDAFHARLALARGVQLARDLVNEPANVLGPVEFAEHARALTQAGVEVEILDVAQLTELKMLSLLAVGQGSVRPSRVAVMQWHGSKSKRAKPVCFVGKGVVFDTGGISIKPAAGMEDMKGDMGGAACVTGLMLALAGRKAAVNAVGIIGLVENMPSGSAMRPGDIVTSMSGQTIEILNTDAEGRLVLADVLWYAQERFKPRAIVDLATLTGAIMVALGKEYAGLFSNDDKLAADLIKAGEATGEKVWRMPLGKAYDKLIQSKNADMKNIGGRFGGAITAAQFLQRFIKDTPWAHLDVAGVAMDSNRTDISATWASGWGVRLLDRLVSDQFEKAEK